MQTVSEPTRDLRLGQGLRVVWPLQRVQMFRAGGAGDLRGDECHRRGWRPAAGQWRQYRRFRHRHASNDCHPCGAGAAPDHGPRSARRGRDARGGAEPDPGQIHADFSQRNAARSGNRSTTGGWSDLIRCAGNGSNDYVYITIPPDNPEMFEAMTEVMRRPDLRTDERFATPPARARNGAALTAEIERWTGEREKREVMKAFAGRGIVCGAVLDTAEVLADPHLRERETIFDLEHPTRGRFSVIGCPVRLSDSLAARRAPLKRRAHRGCVAQPRRLQLARNSAAQGKAGYIV